VEKTFAQQKQTIVEQVMHAVDLSDEKQVSVDMYFDAPLMMATGNGTSSDNANASAMTVTLSGHVKEIAVGLLALLSLFMVSMMVKKSSPAPVVAAAAVEAPEPPILGGNLDIAGEVSEGGQTLDGMELDEDAIKAQQMVEQVSTMVKENPDAAANLVKRWLNRS
jgi:flagellar biosynthesis/type III secretory pathway M-ring protein FliF/YscJ